MSKTKRIKVLEEFIRLQKKIVKESYNNRKLIKAGERESYRQRKIRLNKERRESLHNG